MRGLTPLYVNFQIIWTKFGAYFGQPKVRFVHDFEYLPDRVEQNGQRDRDLRKICSQHTKFQFNRDGDVEQKCRPMTSRCQHCDVFDVTSAKIRHNVANLAYSR